MPTNTDKCEAADCDYAPYFAVEGIELCGWHAGEELNLLVEPLRGIPAPDFAWDLWEAEEALLGESAAASG